DGLEHGAAVALMIDGKLVVDLWGGHADKAKTKPWARDTIVNVWSATKGVMATSVAMMVEQGKLSYDKPIADVWPEFAANGKSNITLNHVMSHTSGLNGAATPISENELIAWTPYVNALAAMKPNWRAGEHCAYHALSYGHLTGEPLRRVAGKSVGAFVRDEIAGRLGVDFFIGVPEAQDHRCAEMIEGKACNDWLKLVLSSPYPQGCMNPTPVALSPNNRAWRAAEIPGGNGHGDARALATIYADICGRNSKLIQTATRLEASRVRFRGTDESFASPTVWGAGFRLEDDEYGARASKQTIGHGGWGGTIAFGDPDARLGFAYVTNYMLGFETRDPRRERLVEAVYDAL
ncbi:MAG: serine hydrolase domain-containing protein, partial [Aestuariivirga sp.]